MRTRQHLPVGLDAMAPGPELAAVVGGVDPARLVGVDVVRYLRGCFRLHNHVGALLLDAVREAGLVEAPDTLARAEGVDDWSAHEASAALGWSLGYARGRVELADGLVRRLPEVAAAFRDGSLDEVKVRAFAEWTLEVPADTAREVARVLLPAAPGITVGRLVQRIQQLLRALDPEWAQRREDAAVSGRRVSTSRNPSGSAELAGHDLPLERVVRANARIHRLAGRAKHAAAGQGLVISVITLRADVFLGLLEGIYDGLDDDTIVKELLDLHRPHPDGPDDGSDGGLGGGGPEGPDPDDPGPDGGHAASPRERPAAAHDDDEDGPEAAPDPVADPDPEPDQDLHGEADDPRAADGEPEPKPEAEPEPEPEPEREPEPEPEPEREPEPEAEPAVGGPAAGEPDGSAPIPVGPGRFREPGTLRPLSPRECVELRVRLTTLLGLDEHPAELPGWGPISPRLARDTLTAATRAEWRIVITDDDGHLLHVALTRRRPRLDPHHPPPRDPMTCAVVEIQVPLTLALTLNPAEHGPHQGLVADIVRIAGEPFIAAATGAADARRRFPTAALARWVQTRDRYCVGPMCTRPARACDLDHTLDHAFGGLTLSTNLGCDCRRCHRLKHHGGWRQTQPREGVFRWTARSGTVHHIPRRPVIEALPDPRPSTASAPTPSLRRDHPDDDTGNGWDNEPHPRPATPTPPAPTEPDF